MTRLPRNHQLSHTALGFIPERLQLARELRHFTRADLGARLGVAGATVAAYENGYEKPPASLVARLSLTLGVPVMFFARQGRRPIAVEACHFRHLRPAQQGERRAQLALTELLADILEFAHSQLVLPSEGLHPCGIGVSGASKLLDPERVALAMRRAWGQGLDPIADLTRLCELNGVVVHRIDRANLAVQPFSLWHRGWPMIFFVPRRGARQQSRFDCAHELGHLVMHADVRAGHPAAEREADAFARAFLLPAQAFVTDCPATLDWQRLYELERKWRVSIPVLVERGYELGLLSEPVYRRALGVWKEGGSPQHEDLTPSWEEPALVRRAFELIADEWPLGAIAREVGVLPVDLAAIAGLRDVAS